MEEVGEAVACCEKPDDEGDAEVGGGEVGDECLGVFFWESVVPRGEGLCVEDVVLCGVADVEVDLCVCGGLCDEARAVDDDGASVARHEDEGGCLVAVHAFDLVAEAFESGAALCLPV